MVTIEQVQNGVTKYVDSDILPRMTGGKRFALGVYVALAVESLEDTLLKYKDHPALSALNIIDTENNIDIDRLYDAALSAMSDKLSIDIPMMGVLTLDKKDLGRLYEYIKGA